MEMLRFQYSYFQLKSGAPVFRKIIPCFFLEKWYWKLSKSLLNVTWNHAHLSNGRLFKGTPLGLRQFLSTKSPLKTIKNVFYFISKALFVLEIFKLSSWLFGHVAKRLDKKDKVNFRFYGITAWLTNNCNTHIAQYFKV